MNKQINIDAVTVKDLEQLFYRFLKDNNVYDKFLNNFETTSQYDWRRMHSSLNKYNDLKAHTVIHKALSCNKSVSTLCCLITAAFLWRNTIEGHDFWSKLSEKWLSQIGYYS